MALDLRSAIRPLVAHHRADGFHSALIVASAGHKAPEGLADITISPPADASHSTLRELLRVAMANIALKQQVKQLEDQAAQSQDPALRKQLEEATRNTRSELQQQAVREQQGRVQELEMSNQLRAEEAKLNDLTEQINQLDKNMQRQ